MNGKRAAVVFNPTKVDRHMLKWTVERQQHASGWRETLWLGTTESDPGQRATRDALEAGVDVVIAAGGDGTVRAVAEGLHGTPIPLALVPAGTGNLLARNLKLTLDNLDHAIQTAFSGDDRMIDLGFMEIQRSGEPASRHAFLVMGGLGLDAKMLANTDNELKRKAGWFAYAHAIAKALRDKNQLRLRCSLDGGPSRSIRAHTIIIGNCGALPANIVLLPDAAIDDGELDVLVLRPETLVGWVQIFVKVLWENGVVRRTRFAHLATAREVHAVRYLKAADITVQLERSEEIEIDGDSFGTATGFHAWVEHGAITVKVPGA